MLPTFALLAALALGQTPQVPPANPVGMTPYKTTPTAQAPPPAQYVPVAIPPPQTPPLLQPTVYTMPGPTVQVAYPPPVQQTILTGSGTTSTSQMVLGGGLVSMSLARLGRALTALGQPRVITINCTKIAPAPSCPSCRKWR